MSGDGTLNGLAARPDAAARSRVADAIEVIALILTGYVCHLYYNLIGHLSSLRGVDYGPWFLTPVDRAIPYAPVWVHAYQIAYFMPGAVLLLLVARLGFNATAVRRILVAFLSLLFTHYALYLTLPTRAASVRLDDAVIGTDQGKRYVLVVGNDGVAQYRPVKPGALVDGLRVIKQGLNPGEAIVVRGLVRPGTKISPRRVSMTQGVSGAQGG